MFWGQSTTGGKTLYRILFRVLLDVNSLFVREAHKLAYSQDNWINAFALRKCTEYVYSDHNKNSTLWLNWNGIVEY